MKHTFKNSHQIKYVAAVMFFLALIFAGLYGVSFANQPSTYKGNGFAWGAISDNANQTDAETGIGYLSFACENDGSCDQTATTNFPSGYGVRINTNPESEDYGKFFGYAWSSNYGWVSFYHNDVAECGPAGGLEVSPSFLETVGATEMFKGYARVLNYDSAEWNGCINFGGDNQDGTSYQTAIMHVEAELLELKGFAWGGNVVGWIDFGCDFCKVTFSPVLEEEECIEADDPEVCEEEEDVLDSGLALYVGPSNANPPQIVGNTTYTATTTDFNNPVSVKLVPQAFDNPVDTCTATASANQGADISGWSGALGSLNPLNPDIISNQFVSTISDYAIGEIITYTINCLTVETDTPVSGQAFVTIQYPEGSVSIDADPAVIDTVLDPNAETTLSWNFSNVQDDSCSISGFVDFTPADGTDDVSPMTNAFGQTIGFNSWSPDDPGSQNLSQIQFPMVFVISCDDYGDQELSDSTYITTTEFGCTDSMEAAGWCSNDINPIFEEF